MKAYREKMEGELRELEAKIELLRAEATKTRADTKIELQEELEILKKKKSAFQRKVKNLKGSTESALEGVKVEVQMAYRDLKRSLVSASSWFK